MTIRRNNMATIKSIKAMAKSVGRNIKATKAVYSKKYPDTPADSHWRRIVINQNGTWLKEINKLIREIEALEG
jgi:hypothetical protein